jgi:uncharacterized protein
VKVLIFGASGNIGSAIAKELVRRGHSVTAATRSGAPIDGLDVPVQKASAADPETVARLAAGQDAVASAVGPRHGADNDEAVLVGAALGLIEGARKAGVKRLVVLGGAGSLEVAPGVRLVDTPRFPAEWKPNALAQAAALRLFRTVEDLDWTYISPPALIERGAQTGTYRRGSDQLLTDANGNSRITYPDYAIAYVDELEQGNALRQRITVAQ